MILFSSSAYYETPHIILMTRFHSSCSSTPCPPCIYMCVYVNVLVGWLAWLARILILTHFSLLLLLS